MSLNTDSYYSIFFGLKARLIGDKCKSIFISRDFVDDDETS